MAFQLSPGVNFSEIDLTNATAAVATTEGAIAGVFRWGPINERTLITSENQLVDVFGAPSSRYTDSAQTQLWTNHETFYTAANFLGYSDALYVTRVVESQDADSLLHAAISVNSSGTITGKYHGELGDSISVSYCKGSTEGIAAFNGKQYGTGNATITIATGATSGTIGGLENAAEGQDIDAGDLIELLDANGDSIQTLEVASNVVPGGGDSTTTIAALSLQAYTSLTDNDNTSEGVIIGSSEMADDGSLASVFTVVNADIVHADDTIQINDDSSEDHGLQSGDAVTISVAGSAQLPVILADTSAGNLDYTATYFAIRVDAQKIKLAYTEANATAGTPVPVDITDISGVAADTWTVTSAGDVDDNADNESQRSNIIILGEDVSITDGQPVRFTGTASQLPVGVVSGTIYYAIPVDSKRATLGAKLASGASTNAIKLATTFENAEAYTDANQTNIFLTGGATAGTTAQFEIFALVTANITFTGKYKGIQTSGLKFKKYWGGSDSFDSAPSSSSSMHVLVKDTDGEISGTAGTVLEAFPNVSLVAGVKAPDGTSSFIEDVLDVGSKWIRVTTASAATLSGNGVDYIVNDTLSGGSDGKSELDISLGNLAAGYDLYKDASDVDVSFILQGKPRGGTTLSNYIIDNIADVRRDCVAFVSPELAANSAQKVVTFASTVTASTYAVVDTGYKYQYDKFSDVYRWVPLNGDIAGLCARTDDLRDPWFSPAGYSRGNVKNVVKLNFNPNKSQRDLLYKNGINPVITQPGQGTVLFGDKTYAPTTSSFDRINVRRLFIVLEKTIARAAKSSLFEFNDEFTRAQFVNLVEPFLRNVQGRRGIYDFKVICDESNNTGQVIDTNSFVGDIYIKPARSINFIQLNFVAVRTGVEFSEVVGAA